MPKNDQSQATKDFLVVKGTVEENLPATTFRVKLENGQDILCHLAGKLRKNRIRLSPGDDVQIEISPYDLTKGRIIYRF
jgi:translation initiation factor IF-1